MKIAVVLLSQMIFFLNAVPCCWDACDDNQVRGHLEETSGTADTCSPFLICGSCTGFVHLEVLPEFPCFSLFFGAPEVQDEVSFQADYVIRIWQPPKEV